MRRFIAFSVQLASMCFLLQAEPCVELCSARVMPINLASHKDARTIARELQAKPVGLPDILLLQEVRRAKNTERSVAEDLGKILGMHTAFAAPGPGPTNVGVAILSRWELSGKTVHRVRRFYKLIKVRPRLALGVTIKAPWGPMRVWTTHLDTRINVAERQQQLQPILHEADSFSGPSIFGGDLNTLSLRWLLHSVPFPSGNAHARAVRELMRSHGFTTPFEDNKPTFDMFGLQLDWVYLRGLAAVRKGIEPLEFSDHHAVWTEFVTVPSEGSSSRPVDRR